MARLLRVGGGPPPTDQDPSLFNDGLDEVVINGGNVIYTKTQAPRSAFKIHVPDSANATTTSAVNIPGSIATVSPVRGVVRPVAEAVVSPSDAAPKAWAVLSGPTAAQAGNASASAGAASAANVSTSMATGGSRTVRRAIMDAGHSSGDAGPMPSNPVQEAVRSEALLSHSNATGASLDLQGLGASGFDENDRAYWKPKATNMSTSPTLPLPESVAPMTVAHVAASSTVDAATVLTSSVAVPMRPGQQPEPVRLDAHASITSTGNTAMDGNWF